MYGNGGLGSHALRQFVSVILDCREEWSNTMGVPSLNGECKKEANGIEGSISIGIEQSVKSLLSTCLFGVGS